MSHGLAYVCKAYARYCTAGSPFLTGTISIADITSFCYCYAYINAYVYAYVTVGLTPGFDAYVCQAYARYCTAGSPFLTGELSIADIAVFCYCHAYDVCIYVYIHIYISWHRVRGRVNPNPRSRPMRVIARPAAPFLPAKSPSPT